MKQMMRIDELGLLAGCEYIPSPNCDDRPAVPIELLVIHNISLPPHGYGKNSSPDEIVHTRFPHPNPLPQAGEGANESLRDNYDDEFGGDDVLRLFTNTLDAQAHPYYQRIADIRVSAHFYVRRNGQIIQFVPCLMRAWHAGASTWQGRTRCNDFSLGIELEGSDTVPFSDNQYDALQCLTMAIRSAYPIRGIAGHSDIAQGRKTDPGPYFDWARYLAGLSVEQGTFQQASFSESSAHCQRIGQHPV